MWRLRRREVLKAACATAGLLAAPSPTARAADVDSLDWSRPGDVAEIVAPDGLVLEDGTEVRLAALRPPLAGDGAAERRIEDLRAIAESRLRHHVARGPVKLGLANAPFDRHGRLVAQIESADGTWLQGDLLAAGLGRVASDPSTRARSRAMLAIEAEARARGRGLWALDAYAPRAPDRLDGEAGRFHLVEGPVLAMSEQRRYVYFDFGPNWRTDFALRVRRGVRRAIFTALGLAAEELVGRELRVRGVVFRAFGPAMELTHPEQIEVLA